MSCLGNSLEDPTAFNWEPDLINSDDSSGSSQGSSSSYDSSRRSPEKPLATDLVSTSGPDSRHELDVVSTSPPIPTWFWDDEDPGWFLIMKVTLFTSMDIGLLSISLKYSGCGRILNYL